MADLSTCERCGGGVPAGATTCPNCGAPVAGGESVEQWVSTDPLPGGAEAYRQEEPSQPEWSAPAPEPTPEPAPAYTPTPRPPAYTPPPADIGTLAGDVFDAASQEKKRSPWVWVIGCCVGVVVLACCLAVIAIALVLAPIAGI